MTHEDQRIWLIRQLLDENDNYKGEQIPNGVQEQKDLLRALMNLRMPWPISKEFLQIQDEYLTEENRRAGITDLAVLNPSKLDPRIYLWQGDITALKVDAIVNACNSQLLGCFRPLHSCVDNIIHSKAGIQLRLKCNELMKAQGHEEPTGQAKITPAYNLPCKFVLHTVGPIVSQGTGLLSQRRGLNSQRIRFMTPNGVPQHQEEQLASCYRSCLKLAEENGVQSIAFCCISTGVFGFPQQRAAEIALETVRQYFRESGSRMKVVFNVFKDEDLEIYRKLVDQTF